MPGKKIKPHRLKVTRKARCQQPLPRVTRGKLHRRSLRPIQPKRLAKRGERPRRDKHIDASPRAECGHANRAIEFGQFTADRFFLYLSQRGTGASVYTKLSEFPFSIS